MKTFVILLLAAIVLISVIVLPTLAHGETSVGVKKGDWIEYTISITGPPLDPLRNLTWYRTEILQVYGASFLANKTALSVNGTFSSSIWNFNLAEGQVYGWVIIPANLSTGDVFLDAAKSANIKVEGEEQKTLLSASRTITHANDPGKLYREWDKATGVYVYALEHTTNYTVITNAIATNMWSPQTQGQNQIAFYQLAAATTVLTVLFSIMFVARKKRRLKTRVAIKSPKANFDTNTSAQQKTHQIADHIPKEHLPRIKGPRLAKRLIILKKTPETLSQESLTKLLASIGYF